MQNIKFNIEKDYNAMSLACSEFLIKEIQEKASPLICPASGNSPRKTYDILAENLLKRSAFSKFKVISLDEWAGLSRDNPFSGAKQLYGQLIRPLRIEDYYLMDGSPGKEEDSMDKARAYLQKNGPIDICILGVGINGHLGFNEPNSYLELYVHQIELARATLQHPMMRDNENFKPKYGITLGMADILQSKKVVLLVNGVHKREVMQSFMTKKINTGLPVSLLWLHPDVTVFGDKEALGF